jgi:phage terminase small subunit
VETGQTQNSKQAPNTGTESQPTDWAGIQHAFTTTNEPLREIGKRFGVTHAAIGKRARKESWTRPEKQKPVSIKMAALDPRHQRFVQEYLVDLNGTQAAIRAGYSANTANEQASRLLANVKIQEAVEEAQRKLQDKLEINAERVIQKLATIAMADPRELVQNKVSCCRFCYGLGHKYQRSDHEMDADREDWERQGKEPLHFNEKGGAGFSLALPPVETCPHCAGDGESRVVLKDTRDLSPAARLLYCGAKQTKFGVEIQMHNQLDVLDKLCRHLGIYATDNYQKSDPLSLRTMTDAERAVRIERMLADNPAMLGVLGGVLGQGGEA